MRADKALTLFIKLLFGHCEIRTHDSLLEVLVFKTSAIDQLDQIPYFFIFLIIYSFILWTRVKHYQ